MFIDQAKVNIKAGDGGNGVISFRREKFVPKGGPDGGDGGNGGNVICIVDGNLQTLLDFRYRQHFKGKNGVHGQGANKFGKRGEDIVIRVPKGTILKNFDTGEILGDLVDENQQLIVAKGGRGGQGNTRFKSSTNQAPRKFTYGAEGEELVLQLELKLIADVGLVGLPNAGKSTLLSRISAAHPKIADYPFTTLKPNLGIVNFKNQYSFVVADIPGLIEGAHSGKGLGIQFLRHIERTKIHVFLIDSQSEDVLAEINLLKKEMEQFNSALVKKPSFILITKIDLLSSFEKDEFSFWDDEGGKWCPISSITGEGLEDIKQMIWDFLTENSEKQEIFRWF